MCRYRFRDWYQNRVEGGIQEEGAITVSARKLAEVVKELPEDKTIHLATTANNRVEITCGDGVYKIIGLPDEEFHNYLRLMESR